MSTPQDDHPPHQAATAPENDEYASFIGLRATVVYDLYETAEKIHRQGDMLDVQATLFETRKMFAFYLIDIKEPENLQNIGRCFRMRCDLIIQTMDEMFALMAQGPKPEKLTFVADVLNMLANQVGRLTLHGFNGEDPSAQLMDGQSFETIEWYTAHDANPDKAGIQSIWARLQMVHPVCTCQQCRRRNRDTVPR